MANNINDEEIIEKRPYNPLATSSLVIACLALIGGLVFQISEISSVRAKMTEIERQKRATQRYLEFRLRETYKRGAGQALRQLLTSGGGGGEASIEGLRYSTWLAQRDAAAIRGFRFPVARSLASTKARRSRSRCCPRDSNTMVRSTSR